MENNSTSNFGATLWIRNNAAAGTTQYNIGVNPRTTAANTAWAANVLDTGTTYMVVIAYQIVAGAGNDIVKMWVNPVSFNGAEPNPDLTATNTGTDLTTGVQRIFMRQDAAGTTPTLIIDEMRVGLTWADVTPSVISENITIPQRTFNNLTINNATVTLSADDTLTGNLTMQNSGILNTGDKSILFANTASDPIENNTNRIIGIVIMQVRDIGTGSFSFLGAAVNSGVIPYNNFSVIRTTGPTGNVGPSIFCNWLVNVDNTRTLTLTFLSVYDNGRDMTQANIWYSGPVVGLWSPIGSPSNISGSDPRTISVAPSGNGFFTVSDPSHPVPVELASFTSAINGNNVNLNWSTVSEQNNSGFDIERKNSNFSWEKIGNVAGNGTSNIVHSYSFEDRNIVSGKYNYRLKQIDFNGNYKYYDLTNEVIIGLPGKYDLTQNYPNPFNPSTTISYQLSQANFVSLKIYNMLGKEVGNLVNENQTAGFYSVKFDASKLASGIYFYKLQTNDFTATKKLLLLK